MDGTAHCVDCGRRFAYAVDGVLHAHLVNHAVKVLPDNGKGK